MPRTHSIVVDYSVSVRPFQVVTGGGLDTQKRVVQLTATPQSVPRVSQVFLEFHEGQVPTQPGSLVGEFLSLRLALAEFAELYAVLQTESPIRIDMIVNDDGSVTRFRLGSEVPEPTGEGVAGDHGQ